MSNIHALKIKKKNLNRELGHLYDKKRSILYQLIVLEEVKTNLKIKLDSLKLKRDHLKKRDKVKRRGVNNS